MERSTYFWYYDGTDTKAQQVADTGATIAYIKAGGDRGVAWIPGAPTGGFARPQWDADYLLPLTDRQITCYPWFYNWPVEADKEVVMRALAHHSSPVVVLNPETEWRVQSPHSPYQTLAEGNAYAEAWVRDLRFRLPAGTRIGCAPVPSWADLPYEGFCAACDFSQPQHYWHDELMAGGENQVEAHFRRAPQTPCTPILTACREYNDAGVLRLAESALLHPIKGFSSWEAGNAAWQADAMKEAYAMLPQDNLTTLNESASEIVTPESRWGPGSKGRIVHRAETILVVNDDEGKTYLGIRIDGNQLPWQEVK